MLGMVRAGVGISVAPNLALQALALRDQVAIPLDRSLTRDIYLVTREPPNFSAAAAALFDFIQDHPPDAAPRTRKC